MDNHRQQPGKAASTSTRLLIISAALGGMLALGLDLVRHAHPPGYSAAVAVMAGYGRTPPADAETAADEALTGSENEAGYRWAERRSLDRASDCPATGVEFRQGCASYVRVNRRGKLGLTHFWCSSGGQAAPISRASSRSSLARPYICRLTSLSLVTWPSV